MMIDPGRFVVEDLLLVGDDVVAHRHPREHPHLRAGGDDDVVGGVGRRAAVLVDADAVLAVGLPAQGAPAVDLGDLVLLHQVVHALGAGVRDLAAALMGRAERHRGVALDPECLLLVGDDVRDLGVAQQRLGRDAADVEADPAPVLLLDDPHALAELGRADRRDVASGAGTEDQDIEVGIAHASSLVASPAVFALGITLLRCPCMPPTAPTWIRAACWSAVRTRPSRRRAG